jgi:hypothetical protein
MSCAAAPGVSRAETDALTAKTVGAFSKGDFDALDKENERLKHGKHLRANGLSDLDYFRNGINRVIDAKADHKEPYLQELETLTLQWAVEHPKSSLAHVLHASVLVAHAWSYRDSGDDKDVPPAAASDFRKYLQRAARYLQDRGDVALTDSSAQLLLLNVGNDLDWGLETLVTIQRNGLKQNPDDLQLYVDMVIPLLLKSHGNATILDEYIREATKQTQADYGTAMYARLYSVAADQGYGSALFENTLADWPTMKKSYEDALSRFPGPGRLNRYAHMACLAKDRTTLVALLAELGPKIDASQWGPNPERSLESCQRWAKESPSESKDEAKADKKGRASPASL